MPYLLFSEVFISFSFRTALLFILFHKLFGLSHRSSQSSSVVQGNADLMDNFCSEFMHPDPVISETEFNCIHEDSLQIAT